MFCKRIIKIFILKLRFRENVKFALSSDINIHSQFEGMSKIHANTLFCGSLGFGSYIGENSIVNAEIGRFCSISNRVIINNGVHPYKEPFASTAPCFYSLNPNKSQNGSTFATRQLFDEYKFADNSGKYSCKIGNDVWIGEGVFINGGIHIADGSMVLAHAVVTKDVPPYAIVGGVPARIIGYRYDESTIKWLLSAQWWNNSSEWFKEHWELLSDISRLKAYYSLEHPSE